MNNAQAYAAQLGQGYSMTTTALVDVIQQKIETLTAELKAVPAKELELAQLKAMLRAHGDACMPAKATR